MKNAQVVREPKSVTTIRTYQDGGIAIIEREEVERGRRESFSYRLQIGDATNDTSVAVDLTLSQLRSLQSLIEGI